MANPEVKTEGGQEHANNAVVSESVVAQEPLDLRDMVKTKLFELQSRVENPSPIGRTLDDDGSPVHSARYASHRSASQ